MSSSTENSPFARAPEKPPPFPLQFSHRASSLMCKRPPQPLLSREMPRCLSFGFRPIRNHVRNSTPSYLTPPPHLFESLFGGLVDAEEINPPVLSAPSCSSIRALPAAATVGLTKLLVDVAAHNTQQMPHFNPFVISSLVPCQFSLVSFISSPSIGPISGICLYLAFFTQTPGTPTDFVVTPGA